LSLLLPTETLDAAVSWHLFPAGFLQALAAACEALAGELAQSSSTADVPFDIPGLCMMLLWFWRSSLLTHKPGECFVDAAMAAAIPRTAKLAVAGAERVSDMLHLGSMQNVAACFECDRSSKVMI
jgi:hypothetical protein